MSKAESVEQLLNIARIKTPSDLDLLLFFARHPDALMNSEALAAMVGYDLQQITQSLDLLIESQILERTQNPRTPRGCIASGPLTASLRFIRFSSLRPRSKGDAG